MSETKKSDGGPAFPCEQGHTPDGTWNQTFCWGMSLRDWFAGQALAGICAARSGSYDSNKDVRAAYIAADAMLAERGK